MNTVLSSSRRRTAATLAGLAMLALLVAGCGNAKTAATTAPTVAVAPTETSAPAAPAATDTPAVAATVAVTSTAAPSTVGADDVAGRWEGKILVPGVGLEIIVTLAQTDTVWSGSIDIPVQGASGIPLHDVRVDGKAVHFEMLDAPRTAVFDGARQDNGSISGVFTQAGNTGTFTLARPKPASAETTPYRQEEVAFQNGDVTLAGTLTLPEGDGPFPALVLLSGSGQQDRDEALPTVPGYKPFRTLADVLTRQGIAVLRYDDRGMGKSTGDPTDATSATFADDAEAGFAYLLTRPDIDAQRVGLLGHSEGGMLASMIAARNPKVAFVILMAGTAVDGYQTILKQVELLLLADGGSAANAKQAVEKQRQVLDLAMDQKWNELEQLLITVGHEQFAALPAAQQAAVKDPDQLIQSQVAAQLQALKSPWYQFFLRYDPAGDLAKITVPVLAVFGGKDTQVDPATNSEAARAALAKAGNDDVTITTLPSLNHLFQEAKTGSVEEYPLLQPDLSPAFVNTVRDWLRDHVTKP